MDPQPPQVMEALDRSEAGICDLRITKLQPFQVREPLGQVRQPGVGDAGAVEVKRGQAVDIL